MNLSICKMLLLFLLMTVINPIAFSFPHDSLGTRYEENEAAILLSRYLQVPSISGYESRAGKFLANYCAENGLAMDYLSVKEDSYNFAASLYPLTLGKPNIVLLNHIDIVPEGDTKLWTYPPFEGKIGEGYVWGRGALDAKGLAVMQLMALLDIKNRADTTELPFNVTLLCVSGEETGGEKGAKLIVENFLQYLNPVVVLGEGGSGLKGVLSTKPETALYGISVAEKKSLWLKLELQQITFGHGATPAAEYANKSMIEALNRINNRKLKLEFDRSNRLMFRKFGKAFGGLKGFFISNVSWGILSPFVKPYIAKNPLYKALVTNTITFTNLYSPPGPPNKIANSASAVLDCRLLPGTSKKAFLRYLTNLIDNPNIKIKVLNESVSGGVSKPNLFFDALEEAILFHDPTAEVVPILFPATTDNSYFRRYNVPTYGLIPAIISREMIASVHSVDEKISLEAIDEGIAIYTTFLKNVMEMDMEDKDVDKLLVDF